jgi:hypothetical protein
MTWVSRRFWNRRLGRKQDDRRRRRQSSWGEFEQMYKYKIGREWTGPPLKYWSWNTQYSMCLFAYVKPNSVNCTLEIQWGMLQWTVFINKIRMLQQTQRNTIVQHSTHVRMTFLAFLLWLEHQSPPLLSFVRPSFQFSLVIRLFVQCIKVK